MSSKRKIYSWSKLTKGDILYLQKTGFRPYGMKKDLLKEVEICLSSKETLFYQEDNIKGNRYVISYSFSPEPRVNLHQWGAKHPIDCWPEKSEFKRYHGFTIKVNSFDSWRRGCKILLSLTPKDVREMYRGDVYSLRYSNGDASRGTVGVTVKFSVAYVLTTARFIISAHDNVGFGLQKRVRRNIEGNISRPQILKELLGAFDLVESQMEKLKSGEEVDDNLEM